MTTTTAADAHIQFKLGPHLSVRVQDRASAWGLSLNETSRRLVVLSEFSLDIDADYQEVNALAEALGNGHSFARAAAFIAFTQGQSPNA